MRDTFLSRFGTFVALVGSAVGLGNIWKFPYVAAQNGGAAFLVIYIIITLAISIPVLVAEMAIGRHGQGDIWTSVKRNTPNSFWMLISIFGLLAALGILSFYNVVSGWSLEYIGQSLINSFKNADEIAMFSRFNEFVNSGWRPLVWMISFLFLNCLVLFFGVTKGIERCSKFMIPLLFLLLFFIALASVSLEGWKDGALFLLKPDWSKVTGQTILCALGQSFFSLSISAGAMMTYGSYVDKKGNLFTIALVVSLASIVIAILAGLAIFPAVFTYGVELTSGPALVFVTLPPLFAKMPLGYFAAVFFFILLFFAAITSSLSIFESIVVFIAERCKIARWKALLCGFVILGTICSLVTLSQMDSSSLRLFGMNLFDCADKLTSNFLMPIGGILISLFVGWAMKKSDVWSEITNDGEVNKFAYKFISFMLRFICPPVILIMMICSF